MNDDVFVPYDELPKPHTGSFLTAKEIESFKDAFKDFVRVVRCKDCVKRGFDDCPVNGWMPNKADSDWFCADGEKRE